MRSYSTASDAIRDTTDTAAELTRMVARRLVEGQRPAAICAGIARCIDDMARNTHPTGRAMRETIVGLLTDDQASGGST